MFTALDQTGNDDAQMMTLTDEKLEEPTPQTVIK